MFCLGDYFSLLVIYGEGVCVGEDCKSTQRVEFSFSTRPPICKFDIFMLRLLLKKHSH